MCMLHIQKASSVFSWPVPMKPTTLSYVFIKYVCNNLDRACTMFLLNVPFKFNVRTDFT